MMTWNIIVVIIVHLNIIARYIRKLLVNPTPFIKAIIAEGIKNGYTGYNLDIEPTESKDCQPGDADAYATFINAFADAAHANGMILTVDTASWCSIWNHTLLNATRADYIVSMDTYSSSVTGFTNAINRLLTYYAPERLIAGLPDRNWNNGNRDFTDDELKQRFDLLKAKNVNKISIWSMPFPENWWKFVDEFINN